MRSTAGGGGGVSPDGVTSLLGALVAAVVALSARWGGGDGEHDAAAALPLSLLLQTLCNYVRGWDGGSSSSGGGGGEIYLYALQIHHAQADQHESGQEKEHDVDERNDFDSRLFGRDRRPKLHNLSSFSASRA